MYKKKEIIVAVIFIVLIISLNAFFYLKDNQKTIGKEEPINDLNPIVINIDGEVVRPIELIYLRPVSYGVLFLRIDSLLNEYSDLSGFSLDEMIQSSIKITIPTIDSLNSYTPEDKIVIHSATLEELMKLPQIGEKRGQKILDYLHTYGSFDSWETFFKIASVPENAKDKIKEQAVL